jgi:hypothetical protein
VASLVLIAAAVIVAAAGIDSGSPANFVALPFAATPRNETPVRSTKGDRLDVYPEIRKIAGVTIVLRDLDPIVR